MKSLTKLQNPTTAVDYKRIDMLIELEDLYDEFEACYEEAKERSVGSFKCAKCVIMSLPDDLVLSYSCSRFNDLGVYCLLWTERHSMLEVNYSYEGVINSQIIRATCNVVVDQHKVLRHKEYKLPDANSIIQMPEDMLAILRNKEVPDQKWLEVKKEKWLDKFRKRESR